MNEKGDSAAGAVSVLAVIVLVGFFFWHKYQMWQKDDEIREIKNSYISVIVERSKQVSKELFHYDHSVKDKCPGGAGSCTYSKDFYVTDVGIQQNTATTYDSGGGTTKKRFFWFGDMKTINSCYVGEDNFCMCVEGRERFNLCFDKGIRRDEFYRATNSGFGSFKEKYSVIFQ